MFVLELRASDVHAVLGRLLDQTRVAGLKLMAVNARAEAGEYRIRASIDASDREVADRLARRVATIVGVNAIEVSGECLGRDIGATQRAMSATRAAANRTRLQKNSRAVAGNRVPLVAGCRLGPSSPNCDFGGERGSERALPPFPTRRKSAIFPPIVRLAPISR